MNSILKSISLTVILLLMYSCSSDDALTSTGNTDEYFKYTINNGTERVFDSQAKGWFTSNTNSVYQKFFFRAGAETASGSSPIIDGSFTFQNSIYKHSVTASRCVLAWWEGPTRWWRNLFFLNWLWACFNNHQGRWIFCVRTAEESWAVWCAERLM